MASTYPFSLITLEGRIFDGAVISISAPGEEGRFGVLSGHAQMVAAVSPGQLDVTTEEGTQHFIVSSGVCEVRKNEAVLLVKKAQSVSGPDEVKELLAESYAASQS